MERRLDLHLDGDDVTIPVDALVEFARELRNAIALQGAPDAPEIRLEYFGPGGSKALRLVADDDVEGATKAVLDSFWSAASGDVQLLRPQAAYTVRKAVAALVASLPKTQISVGTVHDPRGITPINAHFLAVFEERGRPKLRPLELMQRFDVVGKLFEINMERGRFQIQPDELNVVRLTFPARLKARLDNCRWKRATVVATPQPEDPDSLELVSIEKARARDEDGFMLHEPGAPRTRYLRSLHSLSVDRTLRKAGWNGYDAAPLSKVAVARAQKWMLLARALAAWEGEDLPPPVCVPTNTGGVQLEWRRDDKLAELEFEESGPLRSLVVRGENVVESSRTFHSAAVIVRSFLQET